MTEAIGSARSRPGRAARRVGLVLILLAAIIAVAAWLQLRSAIDDVNAAREAMADAEALARTGDIDGVLESVTEAERRLSEARGILRSSAPIRVARIVPGLRQNIDAAQALTDRAFEITASARRMADVAAPLAERGLMRDDGRVDVALIGRIRSASARERSQLETRESLGLPSPWLLSGRLERAGSELADGESDYIDIVRSLDDGLGLISELAGADEPSRWLIVAANAAEMRGAGGMVLSYAELHGDGGEVSIGRVGPEDEINSRLGGAVDAPLPADYEERYRRYNLTGDIRNATLSADFTLGGPIIEAMYEDATGQDIDGVIQLDSMTIARLLGVTGPVSVEDVGEVGSDSVVDITLHELYERYDDTGDRQDALSTVAAAVVDELVAAGPDPLDLLTALQESLHARNLMLYSSDAKLAETITALGASGALPTGANSVHLAVQNFAANKLDYFVNTSLALSGSWAPGTPGEVTAAVTISNDAPPDATEPRYVYGPNARSLVVGDYRAHVVLYLPAGARVTALPSGDGVYDAVVGTERGRPLVTFGVDVAAGESRQVDIGLGLPAPDTCPTLTLVPSPRIRPTSASVRIDTGAETLAYDGSLTAVESVACPGS